MGELPSEPVYGNIGVSAGADPHHTTFSRILKGAIDIAALEAVVTDYLACQEATLDDPWLAQSLPSRGGGRSGLQN